MSVAELVEYLLAGTRPSEAPSRSQSAPTEAAQQIVQVLLGEKPARESLLAEASIYRPKRSRIWQAVFTGSAGGQEWRSTGLIDRNQALLMAKKWEAEAREQRAKLGRATQKPIWRVRHSDPNSGIAVLSQKEVGQLLGLSTRAVRAVERRALQKVRNHPLMRQVWRQYLAGELEEEHLLLSQDEVEALFNLARTPEEQRLVRKVLALIQR